MLLRLILSAPLLFIPFFASSSEDLPPDTPVLTRDGATLTVGDLDAYISEAPPDLRAGLLSSGKRSEQILRQLLAVKNLAVEAKRAGLLDDPIIRQREQLLLARFHAQLRGEQLRRDATINAEALARERYLSNPDRYRQEETVTVRHLLVDSQQRTDARALQLAEQYAARVRAGESLADLARQFSDDPGSREQSGELPPTARGQLDMSFADAAFSLSTPGQTVGPVKSAFGYHIIELIARQESGPRPFDDVKSELIAQIEAEHRERAYDQHIDALNGKPITTNDEVLASLVQRYQDRYGAAARGPVVLDDESEDSTSGKPAAEAETP
jgi:parvulin-like peptidyl-prolyl isomerase